MKMYYIIDTYNSYEKNNDVKYRFEYNNNLYCVREVSEFEWGQPQFEELPLDSTYVSYTIYNSLEDALKYVHELKGVYV